MTADVLITIAGMAIVTYLTRAAGLWLMARVTPSPPVQAALEALPGALLVALIAPMALTRGLIEGVASALAGIIFTRVRGRPGRAHSSRGRNASWSNCGLPFSSYFKTMIYFWGRLFGPR